MLPVLTASIGSFRYRGEPPDRPALRGIELSLGAGEALVIHGPGGCGKTTLCYCLSGVIPGFSQSGIFDGCVRIAGVELRGLRLAQAAQYAGLMLQAPERQLFNLSVAEDIAFGPESLCVPPPEIRELVAQLAALLHLEPLLDRAPQTLSAGQTQRAALAATLALRPPVLVFDQPEAHLDPGARAEFRLLVAGLTREAGKCVVIAESDAHGGAVLAALRDLGVTVHELCMAGAAGPGRPSSSDREPDEVIVAGVNPAGPGEPSSSDRRSLVQGPSAVAAPVILSPLCRRSGTGAARKPANVTLRPGPVTHLTSRVAQAEGSVAGEFLGSEHAGQPAPWQAASDEVPVGEESVSLPPQGLPVPALGQAAETSPGPAGPEITAAASRGGLGLQPEHPIPVRGPACPVPQRQPAAGRPLDASQPQEEPLLAVAGLTFAYGHGAPVLRAASCQVGRGERVALTGDNGSGKTTLLRLLAGLERCEDPGSIRLCGEEIGRLSAACRALGAARRPSAIAYLPQDPDALFCHDSVQEEVEAACRAAAARRAARRAPGGEEMGPAACLEFLGLGPHAAAHPLTLPHGARYRLALALMLAREPQLWLLDEPGAVLDEGEMTLLCDVLAWCGARTGCAALLATHDLDHLTRHGAVDRVLRVQDGAIVEAEVAPWREDALPPRTAVLHEPVLTLMG